METLGLESLEGRTVAVAGAGAVVEDTDFRHHYKLLEQHHPKMIPKKDEEEEPDERRKTQGSTPTNMLLAVGGFALAVVGGYVGSWQGGNRAGVRDAEWRGEVRSSLAAIQVQVSGMAGSITKTESELAAHEARITKIELQGSAQAQEAIKILTAMQRSLDQHVLDEKSKGK